ncbi:uncharacterized protein cspg5a isoform X2 [Misgurnus anguillicaudatus]|uniref:uncharacterized protein cspg5a isoform X2 n=1 Tax=Misgurnus anguillicaudatus TaxID=75329 RepID=UPI003CCFCA6C
MNRKQMRFLSRCWSAPMLSVLLAVFLAPLFAHGNFLLGNETEVDIAVNVTSLPTEAPEEKIIEVSPSIRATVLPLPTEQKHKEEEASGMIEEVFLPSTVIIEVPTTTFAAPAIVPDSAENDQLLIPSIMDKDEPEEEVDDELRPLTTQPPWQDPKVDEETTVFDLDHTDFKFPTVPPTTSPPPSPSEVTVGFFDHDSRRRNLDPTSVTLPELQGREATSWAMADNYDYNTSPASEDYPYTSTTETYEDYFPTTTPPKPLPPQFSNPDKTLVKVATVEENPRVPSSASESSNGCRQGFIRINDTCRSPCDLKANYCFNGGQCYSLDGAQVLCRCNIQDYMWHKGSRCESVITEFQVMCLAIGSSTLMVLLLFMTIVCFAKKLHVLKTENNKLRKRSSKYRPSSEHHNDNFSLSTIAEGSHPNVNNPVHAPTPQKTMSRYTWECKTKEEPDCEDDPNAQNKLEDPVKAPPPKEDESLNIQNSLTPKHENHKVLGEENSSEVNSLQNNMM